MKVSQNLINIIGVDVFRRNSKQFHLAKSHNMWSFAASKSKSHAAASEAQAKLVLGVGIFAFGVGRFDESGIAGGVVGIEELMRVSGGVAVRQPAAIDQVRVR